MTQKVVLSSIIYKRYKLDFHDRSILFSFLLLFIISCSFYFALFLVFFCHVILSPPFLIFYFPFICLRLSFFTFIFCFIDYNSYISLSVYLCLLYFVFRCQEKKNFGFLYFIFLLFLDILFLVFSI